MKQAANKQITTSARLDLYGKLILATPAKSFLKRLRLNLRLANAGIGVPGKNIVADLECEFESKAACKAFTLVELLTVIAIISILAALLLPVLSRVKNKAVLAADINNLKQQTLCVNLYTTEFGDCLPWPNWGYMPISGWLYTFDATASGSDQFKLNTGLFWKTLGDKKIFMCPMDNANTYLFSERQQKISSYVMNGAVSGFARTNYPASKSGNLRSDAVIFWETDETQPEYFNDGASFPSEGISARHSQGAANGMLDGSAGFIKFNIWYDEAGQSNKNQLWCFPGSDDGR